MRLITILLTYILAACSVAHATEPNHKAAKPIDHLTTISLPFSGSCGEDLRMYDKDGIHSIVADLPGNLRFGGLLKRTGSYAAILLLNTEADVQVHYLATITESGEIIDKLELFSDVCSEDQFFSGKASYTIDDNLNIIQLDSSSTYKRDKNGKIIDKTVVNTAHRYEYYVDHEGKIRRQRV